MRTLSGDHERFETTYFKVYPGYYFTGDGCRRDADGYYWLIGEHKLYLTCMTDVPACIRLLLVSNLHTSQCLVIRKSSSAAIYQGTRLSASKGVIHQATKLAALVLSAGAALRRACG